VAGRRQASAQASLTLGYTVDGVLMRRTTTTTTTATDPRNRWRRA
jgi:hypothetical protein